MGYPLGYNYENELGTILPTPVPPRPHMVLSCPTTVGSTFASRGHAMAVAENLTKNCIPNALRYMNTRTVDSATAALRTYVEELDRAVRYLRSSASIPTVTR